MEQKQQNQIIKKALLVEDEPIIQRVLSAQLTGLGYEVTSVSHATLAIQTLNDQRYDLIVTDLGLPDKPGESVIQAARASALNQSTPIIVCTAHANQEKAQECLDLGANAVLIKPVSLKSLKDAIKNR